MSPFFNAPPYLDQPLEILRFLDHMQLKSGDSTLKERPHKTVS
jgi:hypothetical protein